MSFFPLISELLPMIMPASTHVVRAKDLVPEQPTVEGPAVQRPMMVNRCDKMCTSVLTVTPKYATSIRHNSEQDAIMYLIRGSGVVLIKEGFEDKRQSHDLSQGDSIFIPAWTEHQVRNDGDTDAVWLVVQSGSHPVGADLTDWGGDEASTRG